MRGSMRKNTKKIMRRRAKRSTRRRIRLKVIITRLRRMRLISLAIMSMPTELTTRQRRLTTRPSPHTMRPRKLIMRPKNLTMKLAPSLTTRLRERLRKSTSMDKMRLAQNPMIPLRSVKLMRTFTMTSMLTQPTKQMLLDQSPITAPYSYRVQRQQKMVLISTTQLTMVFLGTSPPLSQLEASCSSLSWQF
jgi:hypothetical protein